MKKLANIVSLVCMIVISSSSEAISDASYDTNGTLDNVQSAAQVNLKAAPQIAPNQSSDASELQSNSEVGKDNISQLANNNQLIAITKNDYSQLYQSDNEADVIQNNSKLWQEMVNAEK